MPGLVPEHKIAEIQRAIDIVELISGYIPLKRSGSRYKALCPFHHEKTPSFIVSPERQIFKCFGCNEGGDVFKFVMKREHVEFPEAVRMLAEKAGIKLEISEGQGGAREERAPLYDVNGWAAAFFQKNLKENEEASFARSYLAKRRINEAMIAKFLLGYASPRPRHFLDSAAQAKLKTDALERAGLARRRSPESEPLPYFRHRLIFPIRDGRGRFIAFGARALSDEDQPKYLNSPETPIFSKSRTLYGLFEAKEAILRHRRVAIMEGYTDVIMAHQFGIEWAVAVLGTALTQDHVRELKRYADEIVLIFDADSAGRKSSDRSLDIFVEEDVPAKVATLAEGQDPCDFLLNHGAEAFLEIVKNARNLITFKMDAALSGLAKASAWERARALDGVLETVARTPNPVALDLHVKHVAERAGVSETAIRERLAKARVPRPLPVKEEQAAERAEPRTAIHRAQLQAIQSLLADNALLQGLEAEPFLSHFYDPALHGLAECILKTYGELKRATEQDVFARTTDARARELLAEVIDPKETQKDHQAQLAGALRFLEKHRADGEAADVRSQILSSDAHQVPDALLKEFQEKARRTRTGAGAFLKGMKRQGKRRAG